jgi:hypothetical protein
LRLQVLYTRGLCTRIEIDALLLMSP